MDFPDAVFPPLPQLLAIVRFLCYPFYFSALQFELPTRSRYTHIRIDESR